ncbi:MAG: biotin/lipoyl-containing protein [Steroidobacteraceae bacterium]
MTLETEKATMDVPSTVAGIVEKILATKGGTVSPGDVVATVRVEEAAGVAPRLRLRLRHRGRNGCTRGDGCTGGEACHASRTSTRCGSGGQGPCRASCRVDAGCGQ